MTGEQTRGGGLGWKLQIVVFLVVAAALYTRRPDAFLYPQFFGEDGSIWYPEAYMFGWFSSLFNSQNGYYQTLPRLAASLALLVPLADAPLVMNLAGLALQILPVNLLLSARCATWGTWRLRLGLAAVYVALPNAREVHVAIEEGQWHLALVCAIVVLGSTARHWGWRVFDTAALMLGGVSGPFGILVLPIAGAMAWIRRERWRFFLVAIILAGTAIQLNALLATAEGTRPHAILGASSELLVRLFGGRVVAGGLLGVEGWQRFISDTRAFAALAAVGISVVAYCLLRARLEVRLGVAFAFLVFAVSLRNPMVSDGEPQWDVLWKAGGIRYWFFPTLGLAWSIVWCLTDAPHRLARVAGAGLMLVMAVGIVRDWRYPAWPDLGFPVHARRFESARPGAFLALPIFPPGWEMRITKHVDGCRTLPFGWLDTSPGNIPASGMLHVGGWVIAYQPIRHVSVHIDGRPRATVPLTVPRPDVDAFHPRSAVPIKGWGADLDLRDLPPGPHALEFRAVQVDGCDAAFMSVYTKK